MRRLLLASILLAACQPDEPANTGPARPDEVDANLDSPTPNADQPVSSDEPQPPAPQPDGLTADCPIIGSDGWQAHVDAMPGPNANPQLIVSGKVTVPTGGYKLSLRMGAVAESYPVQITVHLDAVPPSGMATQAIETREVRGSWPSEQRVGAVTVRCGSRVLARLSNIETAH